MIKRPKVSWGKDFRNIYARIRSYSAFLLKYSTTKIDPVKGGNNKSSFSFSDLVRDLAVVAWTITEVKHISPSGTKI